MTRQPPVYTDDDVSQSGVDRSDAELITAVRSGDDTAFATLWSRHEVAARRLARQIGNPSNADDLVSEAFLRVLRALKSGSGPDGAFRPYLFSTLRRINIDNGRSYYTRVALTDDERDLELDHSDSAADILADNDESSAAWRAWNSLPDSTKTLLWHLIIEEETPAQIAPLIGTTPTGVSSRVVRARERLRQAFLQQHLLDADNEPCRQARRRFGEYVRDALSARDRTEVQGHLDDCARCQAALFEVTDINQTMRVVIGPAVLGGLVLASHYAAASGISVGAAKGSIVGSLRHISHALKNPAVAAVTVVAVVAVGIGTAFGINAMNSSDTKAIAAATSPAPANSAIAPVVIAPATPTSAPSASAISSGPATSAPATTPPAPRTSTTPTKASSPAKAKTTPKPVVVPALPLPTPTPTPTPTPPGLDSAGILAVVDTTATSMQAVTKIVFVVTGDWTITNITGVPLMNCDQDGTPTGTQVTCYATADLAAGEQDYTVTVQATKAHPAPAATLLWTYYDQNGGLLGLGGAYPQQTASIPDGP
jgi:RNA polymerase sigma factor (sigma-70 family)